MTVLLEGSLWLIGCGNMGGAMLRGWIAAGLDPGQVTVIDPGAGGVPPGVIHLSAPPADGPPPAMLMLAVKPQLIDRVAPSLAPLLAPETVLLSILAGVEIASLRMRFPAPDTVVRVMPNTPAAIGKGVLALHAPALPSATKAVLDRLMSPLGVAEWIEREDQLDAVTAVSGCGPAFLFRFIDALAGAGAALGLPADQAARLALATVEGSAGLAMAAGEPPARLADRVASPGGSTRAGLDVLDQDNAIVDLMRRTVGASADRNAEMAAAAR